MFEKSDHLSLDERGQGECAAHRISVIGLGDDVVHL